MPRLYAKGETQGEKNPLAKLTEEKVREMRALWRKGKSVTRLGFIFGVSSGTAAKICRGQTWAHVK